MGVVWDYGMSSTGDLRCGQLVSVGDLVCLSSCCQHEGAMELLLMVFLLWHSTNYACCVIHTPAHTHTCTHTLHCFGDVVPPYRAFWVF